MTSSSVQALLRVPMADMGVTARSSSLEELPSCVLEEIETEMERGRPRSSNDILHSAGHNTANTLSNLSKLSGWGLSKSFNHSSVVRHLAAAPSISQIRCVKIFTENRFTKQHIIHCLTFIPILLMLILTYLIWVAPLIHSFSPFKPYFTPTHHI